MPVGADASRPVRTLDTSGNIIATDTGHAAPIKTVDSVGRAVKAEAAKVAEQPAAKSGMAQSGEAPKPAEGEPPAEAKEKTPTDAERRREWLRIQALKRSLTEKEKRAGENLQRAEAFAKAKALAESGED